jgi:hypothetical protein
MIVGWYLMVLGGAISDAREILVNVVGNVAILLRALWKRCRMTRRGTLGRAGIATVGMAAVWSLVATVAWEKEVRMS